MERADGLQINEQETRFLLVSQIDSKSQIAGSSIDPWVFVLLVGGPRILLLASTCIYYAS